MYYPSSFRMASIKWRIDFSSELIDAYMLKHEERVYGYTDKEQTLVVVDPRCSIERQKEVLFHEICHAAFEAVTSAKSMPSEEEIVSNGSPLILQALAGSKKLRRFLFDDEY
jgi:hypothetical protein